LTLVIVPFDCRNLAAAWLPPQGKWEWTVRPVLQRIDVRFDDAKEARAFVEQLRLVGEQLHRFNPGIAEALKAVKTA